MYTDNIYFDSEDSLFLLRDTILENKTQEELQQVGEALLKYVNSYEYDSRIINRESYMKFKALAESVSLYAKQALTIYDNLSERKREQASKIPLIYEHVQRDVIINRHAHLLTWGNEQYALGTKEYLTHVLKTTTPDVEYQQ